MKPLSSHFWRTTAGWAVFLAALVEVIASLVLARLNELTFERFLAEFVIAGAACALSFAAVGGLLIARKPENRIARLMSAAGLAMGFNTVVLQYTRYALVTHPGALPFAEPLAWLNGWIWLPLVSLFILFLPLFFPDGGLPSARWRWVIRLVCAAVALQTLNLALSPGPVDGSLPEVSNPYAPAWAAGPLAVSVPLGNVLTLASLAAALAAPAARLRRARGIERQQMKWFAFAVAVLVVAILIPVVVQGADFTKDTRLSGALLILGFPVVPAAVGIAILRYRLYDIDILIRRTLLYSIVSAVLVGVYLVSLLAMQAVLQVLTGATSDLAVLLSTLASFALFSPLRQRLQSLIDRRFYRAQYDTERVLERFSAVARDEVDLERLSEMLMTVVDASLKVDSVSLWMASGDREAASERLPTFVSPAQRP